MHRLLVSILLVTLTAAGSAQQACPTPGVIATVDPPLAPLGQPITVTLTNNSSNTIVIPSSCVFTTVYSDATCSGTTVLGLLPCALATVQVPVGPGQSRSQVWDQTDNAGQQVPSGTYSFAIVYLDVSGVLVSCCPSVSICRADMHYCQAIPNSTGSPASICTLGSAVVLDDDLAVVASQLPAGQFGYFLASQSQGSFTPPGSQGIICVSGNIGRFNAPSQIIQGPTDSIQVDLTSIPVDPPTAVQPGDTWNFQCWYRDNNPGPTSNFTDAVSVTFL